MRQSSLLLSLAFLSACGPKLDPPAEVHPGAEVRPPVEPTTLPTKPATADQSAAPEPVDGIGFQWSEEFGALTLGDQLAGTPMEAHESGGWESRISARRTQPGLRAAEGSGHPGGIGTKGMARGGGGLGGLGGSAGMADAFADGDLMEAEPIIGETAVYETAKVAAEPLDAHGMAVTESSPGRVGGPVRATVATSAPALKAGTTDDNENYDEWLAYLGEWGGRSDISGWADTLDVEGRRYLQVLDAGGRPVPNARVNVLDPTTERVVWAGRAYGDGRVPLYPKLEVPGRSRPMAGMAPEGGWLVQAATSDGVVQTVRWDGKSSEVALVLDTGGLTAGAAVPVDVCFIIDTTGSMGDEISRIKSTLLSVTDKLRSDAAQGVDLRYGAVLYRDIGDEYVTRRHAFTDDLAGFDSALQTIRAAGGGDGPESLNQGLAVGVAGMDWRDDAARVAFVIADAPPHMDYQEDVSYGRAAAAAVHRGIRVHTVAASGLDDRGSFAFRQIAQLTRGQFIYIEYGSAAAAAADHGVRTPQGSNNLDDILYGRIRAEIDGWGRDSAGTVASR